jgi:hypothetical protein
MRRLLLLVLILMPALKQTWEELLQSQPTQEMQPQEKVGALMWLAMQLS